MLPPGLIDIHSHLLPGIDDGCADIEESLRCVARLKAAGFIGTICTPHVWHSQFPHNTIDNVRAWTAQLAERLRDEGVEYHVWPGGEVRLYDGVIESFKSHGVPTLANSRCVLTDFWDGKWPKWVNGVYEWLKANGYQPILAHPERVKAIAESDKRLQELQAMGVYLQGNFACMTGVEGFEANNVVRRLLGEGRYQFMAMDMHRLESIDPRLDGVALVEAEFGAAAIDVLASRSPRSLILGEA